MTVLVPMSESEYQSFVAQTIPGYAAEKVASGEWSQENSLELANKAYAELLPRGLNSSGNYLYSIRESSDSAVLGTLWIAVKERAGQRIAYIYDVVIKPEHQRKGHASGAFAALEDEARRLGLSGIGLHVFGHNVAAQALYLKLGYQTTNITMYKSLEPSLT
jgi:ribosomal protein S18 acetylase RimI-like enzyme